MILVCGATGLLGRAVVERLVESGERCRALLRPSADAAPLAERGVEIARGDVTRPETLGDAVFGAHTVVTTVTAMGRLLGGEKGTTIAKTDGRGAQNLIDAAERAGVERFVYVSYAGLAPDHTFPIGRAKRAAEARLEASPMRTTSVRPSAFQEVWLSRLVGLDWPNRKATVYGRGDNPIRYVAVDDVAAAVVHAAVADDASALLEFGGPEALTRNEVVARARAAVGELEVRHVPRAALAVGRRVLAPFRQELASVMGLALFADTVPERWDDAPLRALGIEPRPASAYLDRVLEAGNRL